MLALIWSASHAASARAWQIWLARHLRRWVLLRNWYIRPEIGKLVATLPPSAHVLDAGSGDGDWALPLHRRRPDLHITCLDRDHSNLARLPTAITSLHVNLDNWQPPSNQFQAILCLSVLPYLTDSQTVLSRLRQAALPGATLVLYLPIQAQAPFPALRNWLHQRYASAHYDTQQHRQPILPLTYVQQQIKAAGWETRRTTHTFGPAGQWQHFLWEAAILPLAAGGYAIKLLAVSLLLLTTPLQLLLMIADKALAPWRTTGNSVLLVAKAV